MEHESGCIASVSQSGLKTRFALSVSSGKKSYSLLVEISNRRTLPLILCLLLFTANHALLFMVVFCFKFELDFSPPYLSHGTTALLVSPIGSALQHLILWPQSIFLITCINFVSSKAWIQRLASVVTSHRTKHELEECAKSGRGLDGSPMRMTWNEFLIFCSGVRLIAVINIVRVSYYLQVGYTHIFVVKHYKSCIHPQNILKVRSFSMYSLLKLENGAHRSGDIVATAFALPLIPSFIAPPR